MSSPQDPPPPSEGKAGAKRPYESTSPQPAQKLQKLEAPANSTGVAKPAPPAADHVPGGGGGKPPEASLAASPQKEKPRDENAGVAKRPEETKEGEDQPTTSVPPEKNSDAQNAEPEAKVRPEGGGAEDAQEKEHQLPAAAKRILRPRQASAPPQGQRSRLRHRDGETGSPGPDHSLIYKEGVGVSELGATYDSSTENHSEGKNLVEVRIPPEVVTLTNKQVRARQLWGTDVYTDDSDLVAVLMHAGYYTPSGSPPPSSVVELRVVVRLLPPQEGYPSSARNNIRSRAWGASKGGCSIRIEKCWVVKQGGGTTDLEPSLSRNLAAAPTLVPAAVERSVTTRSSQAASNRQRYVQEVTVQYNLCNEPWMKYSLSAVADRGLKPSHFTSSQLKKGDVLYLETHTTRFELSYVDQSAIPNGNVATSAQPLHATSASSRPSSSHGLIHTVRGSALERPGTPQHDHPTYEGEKYRFAKCKRPLPLGVMRKKGIPLPPEELEVIEDGVLWDNVEWSPSAVWIRGKEFPLTRVQFMSRIVAMPT